MALPPPIAVQRLCRTKRGLAGLGLAVTCCGIGPMLAALRATVPSALPPGRDGDYHSEVAGRSLPASNLFVTSRLESHRTNAWNVRMLPPEFRLHFFNDSAMDTMVRHIDSLLEEQAGVRGAWDAYESLQPMAFRADLFRYMLLWAEGGIYLDAKLLLRANVRRWASLAATETLAVCLDKGLNFTSLKTNATIPYLWNGAMSARKGCPVLLESIRLIIDTVEHHRYYLDGEEKAYGNSHHRTLGVTGPILLGYAFARNRSLEFRDQVRSSCVFQGPKYGIVEAGDAPRQLVSFDRGVYKRMKGSVGDYGYMFKHGQLYGRRRRSRPPRGWRRQTTL